LFLQWSLKATKKTGLDFSRRLLWNEEKAAGVNRTAASGASQSTSHPRWHVTLARPDVTPTVAKNQGSRANRCAAHAITIIKNETAPPVRPDGADP
jgi:hypothetical protein